ncbi:unnamed protein product [Spirodela intermedia]|uniref:Uncharacterized protein n=1 Tax=Spirodela intermedia TaxID=51605 RepID=A0ABN7E7S7_SPIIN|nr:unnamed protein product [Spirodela intermedia]
MCQWQKNNSLIGIKEKLKNNSNMVLRIG